MDKFVEQTLLYDFYGELLTEHQKNIYEQFFLNDLSLSEIAEEQGISRQGVHDLIKRCSKILANYEDKLHLVEKFLENKKRVIQIHEYTNEIIDNSKEIDYILDKVLEIQRVSKSILDEL